MSHAIHDFTAKLRQPSLLPQVAAYVNWRRALRAAREQGRPDPEPPPEQAPISINLDLTTACNYRCTHCIDWDILNSRWKHEEGELRASLQQMAARGLRSVILIGGGEPTLPPSFVDFVGFLKDLELQVAVVSNGSRGDKLLQIAPRLGKDDWIRLSLDSGSNELFRAMHRPVEKHVDLDWICAWIGQVKRSHPLPRLGYSFIITWEGAQRGAEAPVLENIHEIALATERAKASGFDYISLKPFLLRTPAGAEVMDAAQAKEELAAVVRRIRTEIERAKAFADEKFSVYESTNLRVLEAGSWKELTNQPHTCHMQALRQVLTPTGLFNCPAHRGVEKAKIAPPGSFKDEETSRATTAGLAALLDRFDAHHECREVTCLYNGVNWWLEKMIEDPREGEGLQPAEERMDFFL